MKHSDTPATSDSKANAKSQRQSLGLRMREARDCVGAPRNESAAYVGVSLSTFQSWEAGEREPDATKLGRFAQKYAISLDWLLFGTGTMRKEALSSSSMADKTVREEEGIAIIKMSVQAVEEWLHAQQRQMEPHHKAEIVAILFKYLRSRNQVNPLEIASLLAALAD
ncbi:helix-turn-helix domain-containing protein [Neisseriaceae bacterium TC5R-5]|nr:helix-turn-helix domain-containing protein [Neisseriaceae bacterium TC5R-5]